MKNVEGFFKIELYFVHHFPDKRFIKIFDLKILSYFHLKNPNFIKIGILFLTLLIIITYVKPRTDFILKIRKMFLSFFSYDK